MAKKNYTTYTIYKTDLFYGKNWQLDNIEAYLSTCNHMDAIEGRYLEPDVQTTATIKVDQAKVHGLGYNYLKAEDAESGNICYYYITSYEWASKKSLTLHLTLDVLNTEFEHNMTKNTQIIREHKDRFENVDTDTYARIVYPYSQGFTVAKDTLTSSSSVDTEPMYLIQLSRNATTPDATDKHPYGTYVCYHTTTQYESGGSSGSSKSLTCAQIHNDHTKNYLWIKGSIYIPNVGTFTMGESTITENNQTGILRAIMLHVTSTSSTSGNINVISNFRFYYYTGDTYPYSFLKVVTQSYNLTNASTTATFLTMNNMRYLYRLPSTTYINETVTDIDVLLNLSTQYDAKAGTWKSLQIQGISALDRTNSAIMAIYQVPKVPLHNTTYDEGYQLLKVGDWSTESLVGSAQIADLLVGHTVAATDAWKPTYESQTFANEITDINVEYQGEVVATFDASRWSYIDTPTIDVYLLMSQYNPQLLRFHRIFEGYSSPSVYDDYLFTAAKYVVPLYSNSWTEYVRNGYNYDVYQRELQKKQQMWSIGLNIASAGVSLIPGIGRFASTTTDIINTGTAAVINKAYDINEEYIEEDEIENLINSYGSLKKTKEIANDYINIFYDSIGEENPNLNLLWSTMKSAYKKSDAGPLGQMVVNNGITGISSAISAGMNIDSAKKSYEQTIRTKSSAHTTISGNSTDYSTAIDNIVSLNVWRPKATIVEDIAKVFHLTGISYPRMEIPNTTSRIWFNYIQCIPQWTEDTINNINPKWLNLLSSMYQQGVTVFHYYQGKYDFLQEKANWEVNLINE